MPPNLKLHFLSTHQHPDVTLFISNKLGIFVPILICEVRSIPSDLNECAAQTLFGQFACVRPYRMEGVKSYLLGVSISSDWACMQVICFNGWFHDRTPFEIQERALYDRGNFSIEMFYYHFFSHVLGTLISGVHGMNESELASLFAHTSPAFRFGMESARLPLAKCLEVFLPCNILHCTLSEFKKHMLRIPRRGILFNRLDSLDANSSVVVKASG